MNIKFENNEQKQCYESLRAEIPEIVSEVEYDELYGYKLTEDMKYYKEEVVNNLIMKFCRANSFQFQAAKEQLINTLKWRRDFKPLHAAFVETHDPILDDVGTMTQSMENDKNQKVIGWNLYGLLAKNKKVFQDSDTFLRYRIGVMERGLQLLDFESEDNNLMTQVHDYKNISILKLDPDVKKCSKVIIKVFQDYYPETLYSKFFVNVPVVMSWLYDLAKRFTSPETRKKFVVINNGSNLYNYVKVVPKEYGGKEPLAKMRVSQVEPNSYSLYLIEKGVTTEID